MSHLLLSLSNLSVNDSRKHITFVLLHKENKAQEIDEETFRCQSTQRETNPAVRAILSRASRRVIPASGYEARAPF